MHVVGSLVLRHANTPIPVMIHIGKPWLNKILVKCIKHTLVIKKNHCCPSRLDHHNAPQLCHKKCVAILRANMKNQLRKSLSCLGQTWLASKHHCSRAFETPFLNFPLLDWSVKIISWSGQLSLVRAIVLPFMWFAPIV